MSTDISVSSTRHEGVIVEMERRSGFPEVDGFPNPLRHRLSVILTPDDARDIAQQLCDQADAFERDAVDGDEWRDIAGDR